MQQDSRIFGHALPLCIGGVGGLRVWTVSHGRGSPQSPDVIYASFSAQSLRGWRLLGFGPANVQCLPCQRLFLVFHGLGIVTPQKAYSKDKLRSSR